MSNLIESVSSTSIIRTDHNKEKPYVLVSKSILRDKRLSAKAMGLLCYLLSLPSDWRIRINELPNHFSDGEASIRAGLNELQRFGYITIRRIRDSRGRISATEILVYEECQQTLETQEVCPYRGFPHMDNPHVDNRTLLNTDLPNTDLLNKELASSDEKKQAEEWLNAMRKAAEKKEAKMAPKEEVINAPTPQPNPTQALTPRLLKAGIRESKITSILQNYPEPQIEQALTKLATKEGVRNPEAMFMVLVKEPVEVSRTEQERLARVNREAVEERKRREAAEAGDRAKEANMANPEKTHSRIEQIRLEIKAGTAKRMAG